jgi:hypothetical protein
VQVRVTRDPEECRALWERFFPARRATDLWELREIFQRHFNRPILFAVAESDGAPVGLLPLSWLEEKDGWGIFPGETWSGKTWLEQNSIPLPEGEELSLLTGAVEGTLYLRYLTPETGERFGLPVDEIGYLFHPPAYGFDYGEYLKDFSGKTLKKIRREIEALETLGVEIRRGVYEDAPLALDLNEERFGELSYFSDKRFRGAFLDMFEFFRAKGWLTVTTVLIGGKVAAVDVGCLREGVHLVLAGGTSGDFPGVAKLINLHHIETACAERYEEVDFLCGDFTWKKIFHLTPRPLYLVERKSE